MKNITGACCALALATPLCAGDYSPAPAPTPSSVATESYGPYSWFLGGGGDYMFDTEEILWYGQLGYSLNDASSIFLEAGWIGEDDTLTVAGVDFDYDVDIVPITLNYKYEWKLSDRFGWYFGAGLGAGYIDADVEKVFSGDEWVFMAQGFTGLVYEFTPAFEGYLGVRYMWFDEPDFGGADLDDFDDWGAGLGIRFNF
ncbi:MAG TPA: outer membrane beta-barrel protein [Luteolibacter sp.]|nr:outer membrane beta-barrel protein [Luteolibacter sp.]